MVALGGCSIPFESDECVATEASLDAKNKPSTYEAAELIFFSCA